jgi:hypothetical protein
MNLTMTLAEIAKCADDEIVGSDTAIMDGLPGPNVGLQVMPLSAGRYRSAVLHDARESMSRYLLAGGSPDSLRTVCDDVIAQPR